MALFTPSESPAVVFREIDLTSVVRNAQSSTGAIVGNFRWGPVSERVNIADEAELAANFGTPNIFTTVDFHSAAMFLRYSQDLIVVRAIDSLARNAYSSADGASAPVVKNETDFDNQIESLDSDGHTFIARFPGDLGNSIRIEMCPFDSDGSTFNGWAYRTRFDAAPDTSLYAEGKNTTHDEVHVVLVDEFGDLTGTAGTVLETFPFVSLASNAKNPDGTSNYILDVINTRSQYVHMVGFDSDYTVAGAGGAAGTVTDFSLATPAIKEIVLSGGVASGTPSVANYQTGYDLFEDVDTVQIDFLIAPGFNSRTDQTTIVNDLVSTAQSLRKDCVVITSPTRTDVVGNPSPTNDIVTTANTFTSSSYLVVDNNYLKVYDKYNDQYIWVPGASSTAGIMAASDTNFAPWFSPAGARRGQYLGITALAYSPTKGQRDTLYKVGVNSIANIPGIGVVLYGDKTKLNRPSAFDRINVRRLFLVVERAIADAAKNVIFEFNDEFTRAEFVNIVEPFLREIQGRRGITDFRVVCDETNNTPAVVDRNEFIASIFIKPARSINFVTLNFVAVRTGVEFEEVVGTV